MQVIKDNDIVVCWFGNGEVCIGRVVDKGEGCDDIILDLGVDLFMFFPKRDIIMVLK